MRDITNIPTAAGREQRVIKYVSNWIRSHRGVELSKDKHGNLILKIKRSKSIRGRNPIIIAAHMDHPAFVVSKVHSSREITAEFRGGVKPAYFENAKAVFFSSENEQVNAQATAIQKPRKNRSLFYKLRFRLSRNFELQPGDIGRWRMPAQRISRGLLYTPACDNLASVAAALSMLDVLSTAPYKNQIADIRVLLTRSEEIGFIGAIGACRSRSIPKTSRVIVLETSRSFPESPIGVGPIVRIGDRMSTFDPVLTAAVTAVAQGLNKFKAFSYQRKLMAGGACEATAYQAYGYTATCICLPLGNYHNQANLAEVEKGINKTPAKANLEYISLNDFHNYILLMASLAEKLDTVPDVKKRMDELFAEREYILQ